jgi:hypothetical protein
MDDLSKGDSDFIFFAKAEQSVSSQCLILFFHLSF